MEAQVRALLLLLVLTPSVAEKNLTGTVGGSITLPKPVLELGFIIYEAKALAMVTDGKMKIVEKMYENKLLWSDRTGCFTITDLQKNDSGIYTVDLKGSGVTAYKLSVFDSVSAPTVNRLGSDSCVLLCEVVNAEETTLLWYKDDEVVKQNSSAPSLSLTVHEQDYRSSYRCVAANPAEHKAEPVNLEETCGPTYTGRNQEKPEDRSRVIGIVVSIVSVVVIAIVGIMIKKRYHNQKPTAAQGPDNVETEVQYTDVHFYDDTRGQRENVPEPSGNHGRTQLETVYDKLEVHRLVQHSDRG
ncbi:SLAM family member 7-like isoform X2 [Betta splendens]|uniref:SLAM family member 7-like isoform X2 n=1 Tax=Betta splendens TaxID=158456 RepID=A0A6P7M0J1_BETSP|nr:SLAM family member 7-like isoform X2 [Betta splendens]